MTHKIQIDDVVRDATDEEAAAIDAQQAEVVAQAVAAETAKTAKDAARQAVLDKLGLTADEVTALLG